MADRLDGQLTDAVKSQRSAQLLLLEKKHSKEYRASYIGKEVEILVEEKKEIEGKLYWIGHTPAYVVGAVAAGEGTGEIEENQLVRGRAADFLTDEIILLDEIH